MLVCFLSDIRIFVCGVDVRCKSGHIFRVSCIWFLQFVCGIVVLRVVFFPPPSGYSFFVNTGGIHDWWIRGRRPGGPTSLGPILLGVRPQETTRRVRRDSKFAAAACRIRGGAPVGRQVSARSS